MNAFAPVSAAQIAYNGAAACAVLECQQIEDKTHG
jgi:hypothetical protein